MVMIFLVVSLAASSSEGYMSHVTKRLLQNQWHGKKSVQRPPLLTRVCCIATYIYKYMRKHSQQ